MWVWVATNGRPWPLRSMITGPRTPGATGVCAETGSNIASDFTVSRFNQPIQLVPPRDSVELQSVGR